MTVEVLTYKVDDREFNFEFEDTHGNGWYWRCWSDYCDLGPFESSCDGEHGPFPSKEEAMEDAEKSAEQCADILNAQDERGELTTH
jgi:hypothetical protein